MNQLWDTNIAIYYLQQQFPPAAEQFIDESLRKSQPYISAITEIELLCWKQNSAHEKEVLLGFIQATRVIELEQSIKLRTAALRQLHRIKLPDAIIAATALEHELTLVTRNTKDFAGITGLALMNPWEQTEV